MARALHILKGEPASLVLTTIERQVAAGDRVTVTLLPGVAVSGLPASVAVRRVPDDWSYEQLLEAVFEADQVATW